MKIGIFLFADNTRKGAIPSELLYLKKLVDNNPDHEYIIFTCSEPQFKKLQNNKIIDFTTTLGHTINLNNIELLDQFDLIITHPLATNFIGGQIERNSVLAYKLLSHFTNELNKKVLIRVNDSEIQIKDFRLICEIAVNESPENSIVKTKFNGENIQRAISLLPYKYWNYKNIHWLANGDPDQYNWVIETLHNGIRVKHRLVDPKLLQEQVIYPGDDLFFLINDNYKKYSDRYSTKTELNNQLCYIGFFDTINKCRASRFNEIFKKNNYQIPINITGIGTQILNKISCHENIQVNEKLIPGNSDEYFDFLNTHLGYVYIGKGKKQVKYNGKTLYDAVIARTPIIVYKKTDPKMITFDNPEYYFNNEKELYDIFIKLQDPIIRKEWIDNQSVIILSKINTKKSFMVSDIRFNFTP